MKLYMTAESMIGLAAAADRAVLLKGVRHLLESGGRLFTSYHSLITACSFIESASESSAERTRADLLLFSQFIRPLFTDIFMVSQNTFSEALALSGPDVPLSYAIEICSARDNGISRITRWSEGSGQVPGFLFVSLYEIEGRIRQGGGI